MIAKVVLTTPGAADDYGLEIPPPPPRGRPPPFPSR
ncbi:MAG: hypothetical protein FD153_374, partial [Rhodospirillaceae bacterium]